MTQVSVFADCRDRVYSMTKASFGDSNPIWGNIEASLLPGEKVAGIFGSVQVNRNLGGALVISTDGMRFFDRKAFKKPADPLLAVAYIDMVELKSGLNLTLKTASRDKYSIVTTDRDLIYNIMMELGSAGSDVSGRLYVPLSVTGLPLDSESLVRVTIGDDGLVMSQDGHDEVHINYAQLDAITAGGPGMQVDTRGGGMIGGGFGIGGFVIGAASAALYNRLTTRSDVTVETLLKVEGDGFEAVFLTPEVLPEDLDLEIATARTRIKSAARANAGHAGSVGQQLKELAELRDSGILSEQEFASAKAKLLG